VYQAYLKTKASVEKKVTPTSKGQMSIVQAVQACQKYKEDDPCESRATDSLICFIANDLMPLSVVESSSFRSFVQNLDLKYHQENFFLRKSCQTSVKP
jgi:hypothetical protein